MSNYLEQVVSYFVDNKKQDSFDTNENQHDKLVKEAAKQRIIEKIYQEIYAEGEEKAFEAAEKRSKETSIKRKLEEARNLIIQGFIVAFFVGLAVNQLTEIFVVIKENIVTNDLAETIILFVAFIGVCVAVLGYIFIKELLALIRKDAT